ncbi:MAG: twin-arginine translocase TatA/TatE family subunit [Acidobacteriaceae bacterium]
MSLPDTVFIFVLALIIFGPKKLPEIGRQIGRLVGEFRRASNEFKFQIEEELRQAERTDPPKTQNTIGAPVPDEAARDMDLADGQESAPELSESLPIGQHPNLDAINAEEMASGEPVAEKTGHRTFADSSMPESPATITAAVGAQARTTLPYAPLAEETAPQATHASHPQNGSSDLTSPHSDYPAPSQAEIHHD